MKPRVAFVVAAPASRREVVYLERWTCALEPAVEPALIGAGAGYSGSM